MDKIELVRGGGLAAAALSFSPIRHGRRLRRTTRKLSLTEQGRQSMQRAAEPSLRRGACARPDPEEARGSAANLGAGHPWPGELLCIPVVISEDLPEYPGRPVHHQPVPGSDSRKYRTSPSVWRTSGFEPDRPARRPSDQRGHEPSARGVGFGY
jgi:hypothetical protein